MKPLFLSLALSITATIGMAARPNILLVVTDDQSWPHAGAYGCSWVSTPVFDKLAAQGALFNNAFVSAPSCAPSRFAVATGRHFFQNQEGGVHGGFMPAKLPVYPKLLADAGYLVGFTGKGCGPFGNNKQAGTNDDPYGKKFNDIRLKSEPIYHTFGNLDYAANFEVFLNECGDKPFHFTFNSWEPHRPYHEGSGEKNGRPLDAIKIPGFIPDATETRRDVNDYGLEIDCFDKQLGEFISVLEKRGLLNNTIIVITADNGMPFQQAKMHCYEYGTHVPLLVFWKGHIAPASRIDDPVLTPEIAVFVLEAAKVPVPVSMMDSSLATLLNLDGFTRYPKNKIIVWGKEKHNPARENNAGYPIRAIRTSDFLLVHNMAPDRWPAGDPPHFKDLLWQPEELAMAFELDNRTHADIAPFFEAHTRKRHEFELFDIKADPFCMKDLATEPAHAAKVAELKSLLHERLVAEGDPRALGHGECFDSTPSTFTNPKDPKTNQPIFAQFPQKGQYVKGLEHFAHHNDAEESKALRLPKTAPSAPAPR